MVNAKVSIRDKWITMASLVFLCLGLSVLNLYSFLLFHSVSEIFSIVVACMVFVVAWNSRKFVENDYLLLLGVAYLFISMIDFAHTLSYNEMNIFKGYGANLPTQLWITARYMESASLLIAPFFLTKKIRIEFAIAVYSGVTALVFLSVFTFRIFPDCFIDGQGLTLFKKVSEYIIAIILLGAIMVVYQKRNELDRHVFNLIVASIIITIFAELAFTHYVSVFGLSNIIGHLLKVVSFFLIYKAVVEIGFRRPYDLLFRNLKKSEQQLLEHRDHLEQIVEKRTQELVAANENLRLDLVKREKLEGQLRQKFKMESLGTLAGGIVHDFNNILAAIMGYAQLAMDQVEKKSIIYDDISQVMAAVIKGKGLVHQILTFSRQEKIERTPVQLKPLVEEVLGLIRSSLLPAIKIEQNIKGDPLILADTTSIYQVLMNLCSNAGHAMREKGGTLLVELESIEINKDFSITDPDIKPGPYACLNINDTGCGMTNEVKQRVFDPFYTTKERGEGTGMGLSVVHGIVVGFGGTIDVYSEPGEGSSFKLLFPALERRMDSDKRNTVPLPGGEENILFVDNDFPTCQMSKQFLQSLGYKITACTSSVEALNLFQGNKDIIDLVIADITMPDMSGIHLAEKMIDIKPEIPIILCSGFSSKIHEQYAMDIGVKAYISKPLLNRALSETIRNVIDTRLAPVLSIKNNKERQTL